MPIIKFMKIAKMAKPPKTTEQKYQIKWQQKQNVSKSLSSIK